MAIWRKGSPARARFQCGARAPCCARHMAVEAAPPGSRPEAVARVVQAARCAPYGGFEVHGRMWMNSSAMMLPMTAQSSMLKVSGMRMSQSLSSMASVSGSAW